MTSKQYFIFQILCLICLLYLNAGLQCKVCQKDDPYCLIGENLESSICESDENLCFSWFDRKGSNVGVERSCMSSNMDEYKAMKEFIGERNSGCIKSTNSLDCFAFCSLDNCN